MIKEFVSRDQNFSSIKGKNRLGLAIVVPVFGLLTVAFVYGVINHEHNKGHGRARFFQLVEEGFSYMATTSTVIVISLSILLMIGLLLFLKSYYREREIVVYLKFNDQSRELTVQSKTIDGKEYWRTHKYSDLMVATDHLSDGMTSPMYDTITLVKGKYLVGHIFVDHFTWDKNTVSEIRTHLQTALLSSR